MGRVSGFDRYVFLLLPRGAVDVRRIQQFAPIVTVLSIRLVVRRSDFSESSGRAQAGRHALAAKEGMKRLQRA